MSKRKTKMGRPPKAPADRHGRMLCVRVTDAELAKLKAEAKRRGVSLTDLIMEPWRKEQKPESRG